MPTNFPPGISLTMGEYRNWDEELRVSNVMTAAPRNAQDVISLANWAHSEGFTIRPPELDIPGHPSRLLDLKEALIPVKKLS